MTEMQNAYSILVRKPEEKMPFWRLMHRWREDIKQDLEETECDNMRWLHEVQDIP
jgi:hypothetical protein